MKSSAFDDPSIERAWWAWFAAERGRVMKGGVATLVGGIIGFAPTDFLMYPAVADTLILVRVVTLLAILPALPAFFGPKSGERLATAGQEWLLYVCGVTFAGMAVIGAIIAPILDDDARIYAAVLAFCVILAAVYGVTGLRFRYSLGLGLTMTLLFLLMLPLRAEARPGVYLALLTFGGGVNAVGAVVSRMLEQQARRAFLRARELERENARTQELLLNVVPAAWAARLEHDRTVDRVPEATVLFATVVGFAEATAGRPSLDVVALLDRIVARFDALAMELGVERVKTIGATYMAGAGLSEPTPDHVARAAELALRMIEEVRALSTDDAPLDLRVGLCSGPLVVGVIGRTRYAFDCWGDTVNTASRLEGVAGAGEVLAAGDAFRVLAGLRVETRGRIPLKGKGEVEAVRVSR